MSTFKQHPRWDHQLSLEVLITHRPDCYFDPNYRPHSDSDDTLPIGCVHLKRLDCSFTTLARSAEGWVYVADSTPGEEVLATMEQMRTISGMMKIERAFLEGYGK